jgi:hypothetical protein
MDIDFKSLMQDAKAASALIPDGDHPFECVSADAKLSNSGSPQIVADFRCLTERYSKRTIRNWFTLTTDNPTALSIFFRHMKVLGMDEAFFARNPSMDEVARRLEGKRCTGTIKTESWNGEDRNKFNAFKAYTGAPGAVAGRPGASGAGRPKSPAPAPRPTPAPVAEPVSTDADTYDDEPAF